MNPGIYIQYAIPRRGGAPYTWDWADKAETLRPTLRYLDMFDHDTKGGFIRYPDGRIEHPDGRIESPSNEKSPCAGATEKDHE